eukprot:2880272-Prymnesium_polylepis.1
MSRPRRTPPSRITSTSGPTAARTCHRHGEQPDAQGFSRSRSQPLRDPGHRAPPAFTGSNHTAR